VEKPLDTPLILVTNDDGIQSAGLRAAVGALVVLGEVIVAAPTRQWSGAGRSMPRAVSGEATQLDYPLEEGVVRAAYAIDASPALCIIHAMLHLVPRLPDLVVSGINFGENVSTEVTISGTIGAALEAASFEVPALAVSVEMAVGHHLIGSATHNYAGAIAYTRRFALQLLRKKLPFDVDVLSINLPELATPTTPWQLTRLSRHRYFVPLTPEEIETTGGAAYRVMDNPEKAEVGSDTWCLHHANQVSVTPLSLDLTSRVDFGALDEQLRRED
jgi:5'-nucleotidase